MSHLKTFENSDEMQLTPSMEKRLESILINCANLSRYDSIENIEIRQFDIQLKHMYVYVDVGNLGAIHVKIGRNGGIKILANSSMESSSRNYVLRKV